MSAKFAIGINALSCTVTVSAGAMFFGDRFILGGALLLFVIAFGLCLPLALVFDWSVRSRSRAFVRDIESEPRWIQDAVLEALGEDGPKVLPGTRHRDGT